MEILILHPGALGDIILALPAIALLRERWPEARITAAGNVDFLRPVASARVERVVSLSTLPLHNLYSGELLADPDIHFWKAFDLVVSWTGSGDTGFVRALKTIHPEAIIAGWKPGPAESRHVSQLFVDSLGPEIAAGRTAKFIEMEPEPEWTAKGQLWLASRGWNGSAPIAAIHAGAGSLAKRWPADRFAGLARRLAALECRLLLIEGPAESGLADSIAHELHPNQFILAKSLPLDLLSAVMRHAALFIGNDSGISHLAAALSIPSVLIFGPTLPQHWAPLGAHVTVFRDAAGCRACGSGEGAHSCLLNIGVEQVQPLFPIEQKDGRAMT